MTDQTTLEPSKTGAGQVLSITASAARRIAELASANGQVLRVVVSGGGCSGFQYGFEMAAAPGDDDTVFERDGAQVVVDACSLDLLGGCEIDWVESLAGASFQISNPNAASSCGCGASFSI